MKILQILENADRGTQHMSAEEVYQALRDAGEEVGLATVYRVLTQFESAGLVTRHIFEAGRDKSGSSHAVSKGWRTVRPVS